jgi:hypothetical protein
VGDKAGGVCDAVSLGGGEQHECGSRFGGDGGSCSLSDLGGRPVRRTRDHERQQRHSGPHWTARLGPMMDTGCIERQGLMHLSFRAGKKLACLLLAEPAALRPQAWDDFAFGKHTVLGSKNWNYEM